MDDTRHLILPSVEDTHRVAASLSGHLTGAETLFLSGPVGAGKSEFSRALIKSIIGQDEDVPSPTFTLVQTYEAGDFLSLIHI